MIVQYMFEMNHKTIFSEVIPFTQAVKDRGIG